MEREMDANELQTTRKMTCTTTKRPQVSAGNMFAEAPSSSDDDTAAVEFTPCGGSFAGSSVVSSRHGDDGGVVDGARIPHSILVESPASSDDDADSGGDGGGAPLACAVAAQKNPGAKRSMASGPDGWLLCPPSLFAAQPHFRQFLGQRRGAAMRKRHALASTAGLKKHHELYVRTTLRLTTEAEAWLVRWFALPCVDFSSNLPDWIEALHRVLPVFFIEKNLARALLVLFNAASVFFVVVVTAAACLLRL
eukprot:SAG11_NODE_2258_length_3613_cov_1.480364_5_plen_251_part_00